MLNVVSGDDIRPLPSLNAGGHDYSVQREYYGRTFYLGAKYDL